MAPPGATAVPGAPIPGLYTFRKSVSFICMLVFVSTFGLEPDSRVMTYSILFLGFLPGQIPGMPPAMPGVFPTMFPFGGTQVRALDSACVDLTRC